MNPYAHNKALVHTDRVSALRAGQHPYPTHLHMVLSDRCNLDCGYCSFRASGNPSTELFAERDEHGAVRNHNPHRYLDTDLALSVLDDCAAMGTRAVEFTGGGEPTMHPRADNIIRHAQMLGLDTALISNGVLLFGDTAVRTQWLRVSVDAAMPATYARVRPSVNQRVNHFEKVTANIRHAVALRNKLGTDCVIGFGFVVQRQNWCEIGAAAQLARDLGCDNIRISGAFLPGGADYHADYRDYALALEREAVGRFHEPGVFHVYDRLHETLDDMTTPLDDGRCSYEHFTTYLGADANLYRCCVTAYTTRGLIGNVREAGGFRALWDSQQKRDAFDNFDARQCHGVCRFRETISAINAAVDAPLLPPAPEGVVHPYFV